MVAFVACHVTAALLIFAQHCWPNDKSLVESKPLRDSRIRSTSGIFSSRDDKSSYIPDEIPMLLPFTIFATRLAFFSFSFASVFHFLLFSPIFSWTWMSMRCAWPDNFVANGFCFWLHRLFDDLYIYSCARTTGWIAERSFDVVVAL